MLRHQNPDELDESEVLEGEILAPPKIDPDHFPAETDIEIFVSDGHVNWAQMTNFLRVGMFFIPGCLMASTALIGYSFSDFPSVTDVARSILRMDSAEPGFREQSDGRSLLGRGAYSLIGWEPETAVSLPDGQQVHARLSFLSQLPDSRIGQLDADGYRQLIDDYRASITRTPSADEQEIAQAEDDAARLEEVSEWDLRAWNVRYRIATLGATIVEPTEIETVPAQGFWKTESNLDLMAADGVIASDEVNFYPAAYVDGVPAVSMFTSYGCYTILGVGYDGCEPLSEIGFSALERVRDTLYGDAPELIDNLPVEVETVAEDVRWYLDFPLLSETSKLSSSDFDTLFKAIEDDARQQTLHTSITGPVSLLPDTAMEAPAKGLLKNPAALEAMKNGGVVGTTDVPGRVVVAAYVDNEVRMRVRTEDGLCSTVFGNETYDCRADDLEPNAELRELVTSLYEVPEIGDGNLKPYFWFADAPMVAEVSLGGGDIVTAFNAALNDVANNGDNIAAWTNTPELEDPPLIARPDGFFSNPDNLAALGTKGAVILPRETQDTFMIAANFEGRLTLNIVEIPAGSRYWTCSAVLGQPGSPISECRSQDLTKHSDVLKTMFAD